MPSSALRSLQHVSLKGREQFQGADTQHYPTLGRAAGAMPPNTGRKRTGKDLPPIQTQQVCEKQGTSTKNMHHKAKEQGKIPSSACSAARSPKDFNSLAQAACADLRSAEAAKSHEGAGHAEGPREDKHRQTGGSQHCKLLEKEVCCNRRKCPAPPKRES